LPAGVAGLDLVRRTLEPTASDIGLGRGVKSLPTGSSALRPRRRCTMWLEGMILVWVLVLAGIYGVYWVEGSSE
jgi:hypothetical protein